MFYCDLNRIALWSVRQFQVPGAQNNTKHNYLFYLFFFTLYLQGHVYLNSHYNDGSFLFNCGVRGEIGQRVHPHSQAIYRWQVQPIRISNSTHAVFGHGVDCAISISKDDGRFLEEKICQHLRFIYSEALYNMSCAKLQKRVTYLGDFLTCPAVKMATLRSLCPRKARLLVGKLFSCSALPVARSKIQYLTQLPVFSTA